MARNILLLLLFSFLIPLPLHASGVGFVPSTRIWFSRSSFGQQETIKIYTVVINNEYASLDAIVGFYANGSLVASQEITHLKQEEAKQLSVSWKPADGTYAMTAKFIQAIGTDSEGNTSMIDVSAIDTDTVPVAIQSSDTATIAEESQAQGPNLVTKQKDNEETKETPLTVVVEQQGDKKTLSIQPTPQAKTVSSMAINGAEALRQAEQFISTVTNSAAQIEEAYAKTKKIIAQTDATYKAIKDGWEKTKNYASKGQVAIRAFWEMDWPRRSAALFGIFLFLVCVGHVFRRRGDFD